MFGSDEDKRPVVVLKLAQDGLPAGATVDHDTVEKSARITWYDETKASWYQTYYDDPQSMAPKAKLAVTRGLAGMGIWALGYERGAPDLHYKIVTGVAISWYFTARSTKHSREPASVTSSIGLVRANQ